MDEYTQTHACPGLQFCNRIFDLTLTGQGGPPIRITSVLIETEKQTNHVNLSLYKPRMLALVSNQNFTLRGHSPRSKIKKLDIFEISKNTLILISQGKIDINQKFNSLEWYLS